MDDQTKMSGPEDTVRPPKSDAGPPRQREDVGRGDPTLLSDYPELSLIDPAHYVLVRELARGGMGRIWVARDRRLGRAVAVKETLVASPAVARRFEREAR